MNIIGASFALVFGLISLCTNGLSGLVLHRNLSLTHGSPIIYYFLTLACMYFLKGVVTVCWSISALARSPDETILRRIGNCAYWTTALSLFLTLLAMTVERYMNTVSLKRFQWLRARKRVYIYFCLIIVVFSLICGQLVVLEDIGGHVEFLICLVAEVAFILTIIVFIYLWLKQNSKENARRQDTTHIRAKSEFEAERKLNTVVLCYIIGTLVTVLPFFIAFQAKLVSQLFYDNYTDGHLDKLLDVYSMFTCLNYGLTPLFYFCVLPEFKKSVLLVLSCKQLRQTPLDGSIMTEESEETTSGGELV